MHRELLVKNINGLSGPISTTYQVPELGNQPKLYLFMPVTLGYKRTGL